MSSSYSEDTAIVIAVILTITALFITYLSYITSFKWIWFSRVLNVSGYAYLGLRSGSILSEMSYNIETGSPSEVVQLSIWAIGIAVFIAINTLSRRRQKLQSATIN